jgi:hypothetical protein
MGARDWRMGEWGQAKGPATVAIWVWAGTEACARPWRWKARPRRLSSLGWRILWPSYSPWTASDSPVGAGRVPSARGTFAIRHGVFRHSPKGQSPVPPGSVRRSERVLRHSRACPSPVAGGPIASASAVGPNWRKGSSPFVRGSFASVRRASRQCRKGSLSGGSRSGVGGEVE